MVYHLKENTVMFLEESRPAWGSVGSRVPVFLVSMSAVSLAAHRALSLLQIVPELN